MALTLVPPLEDFDDMPNIQVDRLSTVERILLICATTLTLLTLVLACGKSAADAADALIGSATGTVVVHDGDTLWSIARQVAPTADPWETISRLQSLNHLSSTLIIPGQRLVVPVFP